MKDCCSSEGAKEDGPGFVVSPSRRKPPSEAQVDPCCASGSCAETPDMAVAIARSTISPSEPPVEHARLDDLRVPSATCTASQPILGESARKAPADDCCAGKEHELVALSQIAGVKRVLQVVLAINLVMFVVEFAAGLVANSTALMADSVDMLGDALVYGLSLYALSRSLRWRAGAAVAKGAIIALFGIGVVVEVVLKTLNGVTPTAPLMAMFGAIALVANLTCLVMLYRYRNRDVNMSSTFECSRNDVIANTGVLAAAAGVALFGNGWPDILVGGVIAAMFFRSAIKVLREAWPQFRAARPNAAVAFD